HRHSLTLRMSNNRRRFGNGDQGASGTGGGVVADHIIKVVIVGREANAMSFDVVQLSDLLNEHRRKKSANRVLSGCKRAGVKRHRGPGRTIGRGGSYQVAIDIK